MLTLNAFLFLITLCVAKSETDFETMCKNDFRDDKNNFINVSQYCSDKLCLEKCCSPDKLLIDDSCLTMEQFLQNSEYKNHTYLKSQYDSTKILSYFNITETAKKKVVFLQNQRNFTGCTATPETNNIYVITENGLLQEQQTSGSIISIVERLQYCIDMTVDTIENKPGKLKVTTIVRQIIDDPAKMESIIDFENIAIMISSFFLLLVLIVYCLLPDLRNLTGLVLMAYTWTLLVSFISKLILIFILRLQLPDSEIICKIITPIIYFAFVSSIFWLSVYAFDVWWGLRGFRIKRNSKHAKLVKFLWYALYAWGTPLLLTSIIAVLDNLSDLNLAVSTPFIMCLVEGPWLDFYFKIPVGILIFINIVLFCMTVYNIWMVKRAFNKCQESAKSKQQNTKFATYAKLFLMMGVSWSLELISTEDVLWKYILTNLFNLLIGVNIFYMFVCKKIILLQLCKKFNIRNNYIKNLELELTQNRTQSGITRSTGLNSTVRRSIDQPQDIDLLQNCPKEETTVV